MSDLIDTTEMYLRTIYELIEDGVTPLRARIAETLGHTGPTVSQTIARMERDGLVVVSEDRHLELTEQGLAVATRVMRKHRLAERLLTDVIGLELPYVHDEACRWEHVMSDRVERRVVEMLDGPRVSPYGNPIPGLDELGLPPATRDTAEIAAVDAFFSGVTRVTLVRIGENPQTLEGFLELASEIGLLPGVTLTISVDDESVTLSTDAGAVAIPIDAGRHVFVRGLSDSSR